MKYKLVLIYAALSCIILGFSVAAETRLSSAPITKNAPPINDPPLATTKWDELFKFPIEHSKCQDFFKGPSCNKICAKMTYVYDDPRDFNGRDMKVPDGTPNGTKWVAKPERLDMTPLPTQKIKIPYKAKFLGKDSEFETYEVGNPNDKDCKLATVWIHGAANEQGEQGMHDDSFGGAFNRMKHLAANNHGLYYSPFVDDFGDPEGMAALIHHIRTKSCPKGKIIVACGSAGNATCWALANHKKAASELGGLVFIASGFGGSDDELAKTEAVKARVPLIFGQGENDGCSKEHPKCGAYKPLEAFVDKLHESDKSYPVRFVLYENGGHMTPLRMLDWREAVNCMYSQTPAVTPTQKLAGSGDDATNGNAAGIIHEAPRGQ